MNGWTSTNLGQVVTLNYGWSLPKRVRVLGTVPVYGSNGIVGSHNKASVPKPGLIVGRKGSAGNVHFSAVPFCPIDTTFFVTQDDTDIDILFLYYLLLHIDLKRILGDVGVPGLNREMAYKEQVIYPEDIFEQRKIAAVLNLVRQAIEQQERLIDLTTELKKTLMHKLFTEGLYGEPRKETEIGLVPESWKVSSIGECCIVVNSSMSYTNLMNVTYNKIVDAVNIMGVKVSDMNLTGNETKFQSANLIKQVPLEVAVKKTVPANTVVFPKRGAAIATNKKRLTTSWTVLDPNLIGLVARDSILPEYIYYWILTFDLTKITTPGPTPQLNKKDLVPVKLPFPIKQQEQQEIVNILSLVDVKIGQYIKKKTTLDELFHTLLHQLMTAQIRVNDLDLSGLEEQLKE